jgi:hypothetical protein
MNPELDRLRQALLAEAPEADPALGSRVLAATPEPSTRGGRTMALVGALLALVVVGTLLVVGHRLGGPPPLGGSRQAGSAGSHASAPPARGAIHSPAPSPAFSPLPPDVLSAAHLTNVADRVQRFDVACESSGQIAHLIAVYSDTARTVFVLEAPPTGVPPTHIPLTFSASDQQGFINASSSSAITAGGDTLLSLDAGLRPGADGTASVTLQAGQWSFALTVNVDMETVTLQAPAQVVVGSWTYRLTTVEETPNVIHVVAQVSGARVEDVAAHGPPGPLTMTDPGGTVVQPVSLGASITGSKSSPTGAEVRGMWQRGVAGTYRLTIHNPTGQKDIDLVVS